MPRVSVIVPAFNTERYIKDTLLSILGQAYQDLEILVVDDASTDNTREVVNSLNSEKIIYIRLTKNHGGPSKPRNIGLNNARGEYIAFFDSDDVMLPGRIESAVDVLDSFPEVGMSFADAQGFDERTGDYADRFLTHYDRFRSLKTRSIAAYSWLIDKNRAFNCLFHENYILTCGVTVRREVFDAVGLFDEDLTSGDDLDMWFRITRVFPVVYIDKPCFKYRTRPGSISTRGKVLAENRIKVLRKQLAYDLSADERARARERIAQNLYGIGYRYRSSGDMRKAREYYYLSMCEKPTWGAIRGLLASLLGYKMLVKLRGSSRSYSSEDKTVRR